MYDDSKNKLLLYPQEHFDNGEFKNKIKTTMTDNSCRNLLAKV